MARSAEDLAFHQLEDQVIDVARSLQPVDCANIGMIQRRQHARLLAEAHQPIGVVRKGWRDLPSPIAAYFAADI